MTPDKRGVGIYVTSSVSMEMFLSKRIEEAQSWRQRLGLTPGVAALAVGLFIYGFGEELWFRYLPAYLRALGGSALLIGAFGTVKDLLDAAYAYPGGILTDRIGTRRSLLLFGALTTVGFFLYLAWPSIIAVFSGMVLVMAWQSLGLPATFSLIGEELRGGKRIVGFTIQAVLKRLPILVAPPIGGLLIERFGTIEGMRAGFFVSVVLSLGMLFGLWRSFRESPRPAPKIDLSPSASDRPRIKAQLHPSLRQLLIADCLIRLCEGLPEVFLVIWAVEIVKISPAQFGLLNSVLMATTILSYFPAAFLAERVEKKPFIVLTYLFFTLFPLAVVFSHSFVYLIGAFVVGGLREIGEPARKALIVDFSTFGARGRTVGYYYMIRGFSVAGAAAIGGALWTINPSWTFYAATILGIAGVAWSLIFLPAGPGRSEAEISAARRT